MAETDERGAAGGAQGAATEAEAGGAAAGRGGDEESEVRAEEESAKAMEAEVPHPPGYENPGQEPPSGSAGGESS